MLADRLIGATKGIKENYDDNFKIGYFGASTGGGAALEAAAKNPYLVKAVVSRGGRPDLAGNYLYSVKAATLLIVGGLDYHVIELNNQALKNLNCQKKMVIVPGATHLFEEPGKLEEVANLAKEKAITAHISFSKRYFPDNITPGYYFSAF